MRPSAVSRRFKLRHDRPDRFRINKRTVHQHTQNAIHKLGAVNRTQTVATALRERLIGNDPPSGNAAG